LPNDFLSYWGGNQLPFYPLTLVVLAKQSRTGQDLSNKILDEEEKLFWPKTLNNY
jgi:hypothetical protein